MKLHYPNKEAVATILPNPIRLTYDLCWYYLRRQWTSLSGSSPLCVITILNIKRYRVGESKHNTLLRCKVSQGRRHVSALYYKAVIRSDMVKTKEEN